MNRGDPRRKVLQAQQESPFSTLISRYRQASKSVKTAILFTLLAMVGLVSIVSAYSYTVQKGDTLYQIARQNNTTVDALVAANHIANPNMILSGQTLEIPESGHVANPPVAVGTTPVTNSSGIYIVKSGDTLYKIAVHYGTTIEALAMANKITNVHHLAVGQVLVIPGTASTTSSSTTGTSAFPEATTNITGVPITPTTSETDPAVTQDYACTRFNFRQGRDQTTGAHAGTYVLVNSDNGPIASWVAKEGQLDSGWINNIPIPFLSINTKVIFYPADAGQPPVQMEIVNPAPGSSLGWLTRELCHATEIQFPADG